MAFTLYIGTSQGVTKYITADLPLGVFALQSVTALEASRLRVVFNRNVDFTYPPLLDPANYLLTWTDGLNNYVTQVFNCVQYDAQTVDLYIPVISPPALPISAAHLKVLEARDTRGVKLDAVLNETDFAVAQIAWGASPKALVALLGSYEGLDIAAITSGWPKEPTGTINLMVEDDPMKRQFQSTEPMLIRFRPFLNKNDWSYFQGTDTCKVLIRCPDGVLLETGIGGVPTAIWDTSVKMWSLDLPASYYTDHHSSASNEWKFYARSFLGGIENPDGVPQWMNYFWGDYVDDITTGKNAAVNAAATATEIEERTENLPDDPASQSVIDGEFGSVGTVLGTPATGSVSGDLAQLKTTSDLLEAIAMQRWKIDDVTKQLILYKTDGLGGWIEFGRFDLYDKDGYPTTVKVYDRVPHV
jgi:hypothetical protein